MKDFSTGVPVVSAVITTPAADGDPTVTELENGTTLTNLVLARTCGEDRTIASATVKGFVLKTGYPIPNDSRIYDGVPVRSNDLEGSHFGLAEEVTMIDKVLIEIPGKTKDDDPTCELVPVGRIKSMTVTAPAADDKGSGGDKTPGGGTPSVS